MKGKSLDVDIDESCESCHNRFMSLQSMVNHVCKQTQTNHDKERFEHRIKELKHKARRELNQRLETSVSLEHQEESSSSCRKRTQRSWEENAEGTKTDDSG